MAASVSCPTVEMLCDLMLGQYAGNDRPALGDHLRTCQGCSARVHKIVQDDPRFENLRASLRTGSSSAESTFLEAVVRQVKGTSGAPKTQAEFGFLAPPLPEYPTDLGMLDRYRIVKQIGEGGMGQVFYAIDSMLKRTVALKIILPKYASDQTLRERFLEEARATVAVRSPHVAEVYDCGVWQGIPYLTMELLVGMTLDKKGKPMPVDAWRRIAFGVAKGLADAHRCGMIHRDLKPSNIHLGTDPRTKKPTVKIIDFGLARPVERTVEMTKAGEILGTPAYMSPEQARNRTKIDHRTDLYSLGVILHQLATGRLPYLGADEGVMAILTELVMPDPLPSVTTLAPNLPPLLASLIDRLLAKNPADRIATADKVMEILKESLTLNENRPPEPVISPEPKPTDPPTPPSSGTEQTSTSTPYLSIAEMEKAAKSVAVFRPQLPSTPLQSIPFANQTTEPAGASMVYSPDAPTEQNLVEANTNADSAFNNLQSSTQATDTTSPVPGKTNRKRPAWIFAAVGVGLAASVILGLFAAGVFNETAAQNPQAKEASKTDTAAPPPSTEPTPPPKAAEPEPKPEPPPKPRFVMQTSPGFTSLFDGNDITEWKRSSNASGQWDVQDGVLQGSVPSAGGLGGASAPGQTEGEMYLWRDDLKYSNFHLRIEAIKSQGTPSCLYLFGKPTSSACNAEHQIWLGTLSNMNNYEIGRVVYPSPDDKKHVTAPLIANSFLAQKEWYTLDIRVWGRRMTVDVNNVRTTDIDATNIPLFTAPFVLSCAAGGQVSFRRIEIRSLYSNPWPAPVVASNTPPTPPPSRSTTALANPSRSTGSMPSRTTPSASPRPPRRPPADPWATGTIWRGVKIIEKGTGAGETQFSEFTITERKGNQISGTVHNDGPGRFSGKFTGSINGNSINWSERDDVRGFLQTRATGSQVDGLLQVTLITESNSRFDSSGQGRFFRVQKFNDKDPAPLDEFYPLYNGTDLESWETHVLQAGGWKVDRTGKLVGSGLKTSHLYSIREYGDLHVWCRCRIKGGDSGLFVRSSYGPGRGSSPSGYEAQISPFNGDDPTGSLVTFGTLTKASAGQLVKPNEWFDLEFIIKGNDGEIRINGKRTVQFTAESDRPKKGRIALQLQDEKTEVEFAMIAVKEWWQ